MSRVHRKATTAIITLALFLSTTLQVKGQGYDLVINNGRVIDPETKLDAMRYLGVKDGTIAAVSEKLLDGTKVIDATGLIVGLDLSTFTLTARTSRPTACRRSTE